MTVNEFDFFGETNVLLLNPSSKSILETREDDLSEIQKATRHNLTMREDDQESMEERVNSVSEEFKIWKEIMTNPMTKDKITEYVNWPFPEYRYQKEDKLQLLDQTKAHLLGGNRLGIFLR